MTTRELLRYTAYRIDCEGQACGGGETCEKKPPCPGVAAALRAIADRFDAEMGDAKVNLDRAETRGDAHARRAFYVAGMLLARLDAPVTPEVKP